MKRLLTILGSTAALLTPAAVSAQSIERQVERLAESIAMAAERLAARIEQEIDKKGRRDPQFHFKFEQDGQPSRSRLDTTITFSSSGLVDLTNVSGDIVVTGSERSDARISAYSERGSIEFDLSSTRITIELRPDRYGNRSRSGETRFEVAVPRGVRVITRTNSGNIRIRGTRSDVEAKSMSGDIDVEDAGRTEVGTISGDITVRGVRGDVDANAISGSIDVVSVTGDVHLGSTSGDLTARDLTSTDVELTTTSGEVVFSGAVDSDGRYEFQSHSGNIDVTIPAGASARLSLQTYSGEVESDFPMTLQPRDFNASQRRPRRLDFSVGSGGPRILAETFSGDIEIRRATSR